MRNRESESHSLRHLSRTCFRPLLCTTARQGDYRDDWHRFRMGLLGPDRRGPRGLDHYRLSTRENELGSVPQKIRAFAITPMRAPASQVKHQCVDSVVAGG